MAEAVRHVQDTGHGEIDAMHKEVEKLQQALKQSKKESETYILKIV